ncbi:hypothetical protein LEP1GSC043_0294 [Leptospira weilii str. Ecochallenge]|nr:hypothetical protein LEP1GSC043_0294 [Leptospira weilii str. Ecochallenge]
MMETGIQTLRSSRFLCPECGTTSRLPEGVPTGSIFRLTCYQCGHKVLVKTDIPKPPSASTSSHIKSIFPSDEILPHSRQPKDAGTPHFQAPPQTGFESTGPAILEKIWNFLSQFQTYLNGKMRELIQKFRNIP